MPVQAMVMKIFDRLSGTIGSSHGGNTKFCKLYLLLMVRDANARTAVYRFARR